VILFFAGRVMPQNFTATGTMSLAGEAGRVEGLTSKVQAHLKLFPGKPWTVAVPVANTRDGLLFGRLPPTRRKGSKAAGQDDGDLLEGEEGFIKVPAAVAAGITVIAFEKLLPFVQFDNSVPLPEFSVPTAAPSKTTERSPPGSSRTSLALTRSHVARSRLLIDGSSPSAV
jgi:hypothetical protein